MTRVGVNEDVDSEQEEAAINPEAAAVILEQAREHARRELEVRYPLLYGTWGLAALIGYGVLWLSIRTQHPYQGYTKVNAGVWLLLILLGFFSVVIRVSVIGRALTGVGGRLPRQWSVLLVALPAGTAALWIQAGALSHAGASRSMVGVLVAAAPMLSAGVVFLASSAVRLDWSSLVLGAWLLAAAAGGTWAGPVTSLAVYALAGGAGFLLIALIKALPRRT